MSPSIGHVPAVAVCDTVNGSSNAFVACPVAIQLASAVVQVHQQELYRQAYEQARVAIESKRQRRELAYQWN